MAENLGVWQNSDMALKLELKLPDSIQSLVDQVNSVIEIIQVLLDIALSGLRIAKAFLAGLLDPIKALLDALIKLLEDIINDIRSIGFYMTGDWWLMDSTFSQLQGGYPEFEKRMVARFNDKNDPSLPKIPPTKDVLAVFWYIGVDFSGIDQIRLLLMKLLQLFQFDVGSFLSVSSMPVPVDPGIRYTTDLGSWDLLYDAMKNGDGLPQAAQVHWSLKNATTKPSFVQYAPPPAGFFIYVSTVPDGISVCYDFPLVNTKSGEKGSTKAERKSGKTLDPDGKRPLVVYGGAQQIQIDSKYHLAGAFDSSTKELKDGKQVVYGLRSKTDNYPIPLESLQAEKDGETIYIYQRMFYVSTVSIFDIPGSLFNSPLLGIPPFFQKAEYTYTISKVDAPYDAEFEFNDGSITLIEDSLKQASTVYVRVSSTNIEVEDISQVIPPISITTNVTRAATNLSGEQEIQISDPSPPVQVVFPSEYSQDLVLLIETALYVLILSRSDLEVVPYSEISGRTWTFEENKAAFPTGLESFGPLIEKILGENPDVYFNKASDHYDNADIYSFRSDLKSKVEQWADRFYRQFGPEQALEKSLVDQTREDLLEWKFSEVIPLIEELVKDPRPRSAGIIDIDQEVSPSSTSVFLPVSFTIREAFESYESKTGVFRNPWCAGVMIDNAQDEYLKIRMRQPGFFVKSQNLTVIGPNFEAGSADYSPVLLLSIKNAPVSKGQRVCYLRNLFPRKVYNAASLILGASSSIEARPPQDGQWLSFRLGDIFPGFDDIFTFLYSFVDLLSAGLGSIIEAIIRFIEFVEAKIRDLQDFLDKITFVLDLIIPFEIPRCALLFVKGKGLSGVLNEFLTSESKPVLADTTGVSNPLATVSQIGQGAVDVYSAFSDINSFDTYQKAIETAAQEIGGEPTGTYGAGAVMLCVGSTFFNEILVTLFSSNL